jgi:hypothetical protein
MKRLLSVVMVVLLGGTGYTAPLPEKYKVPAEVIAAERLWDKLASTEGQMAFFSRMPLDSNPYKKPGPRQNARRASIWEKSWLETKEDHPRLRFDR